MLNLSNILDRGTAGNTITTAEASEHVADLLTPDVLAMMARAVKRAVGDTGANEDIVSEACVRILSKAEQYDWTRGGFHSWACQIAANLGRNWRKASAHNGHDSETTSGDDDAPEIQATVDLLEGANGQAEVSRRSDARMLAAAIATLDSDAQTFLGAMADGMGQTEAGALVGWSPATSTRRYRTIVAALAERM